MTFVHPRRDLVKRAAAIVCTTIAVWAVVPPAVHADEFWGLWGREVVKRTWWEMPFAIVFSLPAMVVTTPFWAGTKAVGALQGDGDDEE